jgi:hypothetical protein
MSDIQCRLCGDASFSRPGDALDHLAREHAALHDDLLRAAFDGWESSRGDDASC